MSDTKHKPLYEIAAIIRADWTSVNYAAEPYLSAMSELNQITDKYYLDDARSIVIYFLGNANTWRGATAKTIKAELKLIAGIK